MSTYIQNLHHIVFAPKYRIPCLQKNHRPVLFKYMYGVLRNKTCHVYRIKGVEDHLHILTHIHQTVALSSMIREIKLASHALIKRESLFPEFKGWQEGYAAFSCHIEDKDRLIYYIKNQEIHHQRISWDEELKSLLEEHGVEYDEKYL